MEYNNLQGQLIVIENGESVDFFPQNNSLGCEANASINGAKTDITIKFENESVDVDLLQVNNFLLKPSCLGKASGVPFTGTLNFDVPSSSELVFFAVDIYNQKMDLTDITFTLELNVEAL